MNSPATTDAVCPCMPTAMVRTTVATGVMRLPARTAAPSPAGLPMSVCPEISCATGNMTAKMAGMSPRSCVVFLGHTGRLLPHVHLLSFSVGTVSASLGPGSVTAQLTALMAAMRKTVVSGIVSETPFFKIYLFFLAANNRGLNSVA